MQWVSLESGFSLRALYLPVPELRTGTLDQPMADKPHALFLPTPWQSLFLVSLISYQS
jgi:hypothetical protein